MNLTQFLKKIDTIVMNSPQEKLTEFIHNIARTLPENQRSEFLEKLYEIAGEVSVEGKKHLPEDYNTEEIQRVLCQTREKLLLIENGELCLVGNLNEEYDDWYDSSEDEFIFEDPENVMGMIEEACDLIHQCVDRELYRESYELADMLIALEVEVFKMS